MSLFRKNFSINESWNIFRSINVNLSRVSYTLLSIDENKFYASEDDLLGDDWEDIFRIEEDLYTEPGGCLMYGTRPSEKKDISKVVWKPGDLEGDFVDAIEG